MGISDNGAKVATSTIEALKGNPMVLGLLLINFVFLIGGAWVIHDVAERTATGNERRDKMLTEIIRECNKRD
jgi:hypothetical protein